MVEQLIPMFGLTALARTLGPSASTPDKIVFLIEKAWTHGKPLTSAISFGALGVLVSIRFLKTIMKKFGWNWVTYIPEVFIVVVGATSEFSRLVQLEPLNLFYFCFPVLSFTKLLRLLFIN